MKRTIHIAVFLFFSVLANAQQQYYIKGQVRDDAGNFLQNVNIRMHSTGYIYYSGTAGSFGLVTNFRVDTLTFYLSGFERTTVVANTAFLDVTMQRLPVKVSKGYRLSSITQNLKRETQQQWFTGDETYASTIENNFIPAATYPSTGLTLNVDRASYSNIRRFLNNNNVVPPDAVRIEEMLNYFNFDYAEPPDNKTFSIKSVLTECPWNKENQLIFANITSKKISLDSLPPSHLVFLIDVSGSMDMPNRLPLLKAGFRSLVNNLRPVDSVSIVVYGGTVGIYLDITSGGEKEKIFKAIDSLTPGGATPGESGIKLAYSVARNHFIECGNNRVILATDGDFNVGLKTENELEEMIAAQSRAGIYLTCLGVGMGNYKDSKIQALAQKGNGNFAYIDSYAEAEKVLLKEFTQTLYTIADEVYLNVHFNPEFVKDYRLIGFDNKVGAIKDTMAIVEGGEIGSAFSMLVAFEIVPQKPIRRKNIDTLQPIKFVLQYKPLNEKETKAEEEQPLLQFTNFNSLPPVYRFASAVIMFGSLLRDSKYINVKEVNWNNILDIAEKSADTDNISQKEFITMVQQAKMNYSKKKRKRNY